MKKTITYDVNGKAVERQINYIPVRYIIAVFITLLEVLTVIGIVIAMCYYVPYFYLAAWATEIFVFKVNCNDRCFLLLKRQISNCNMLNIMV